MNVRITPRGNPSRTELYGGITRIYSDGEQLWLVAERKRRAITWVDDLDPLPLWTVAEIALDEDGGA